MALRFEIEHGLYSKINWKLKYSIFYNTAIHKNAIL